MRLVAIDFETADPEPDSAYAIGLVVGEDGRVGDVRHRLIRPPRRRFRFTSPHGIGWRHVADRPGFGTVWAELAAPVADADYLVAHNAAFDRRVLEACCAAAGRAAPSVPSLCTVRLARAAWGVYPTRLPDVCRHLGIPLDHHHAGSDALACAKVAIAALAEAIVGRGGPNRGQRASRAVAS